MVLPAFRRAPFPVGSVTVIAPVEMVSLVDTPQQRPNLYDGLPRRLKVLYLMAMLNEEQWRKLGSEGLSISDLSPDQSAVFLSLLPDPFRVERWGLDNRGRRAVTTLTASERTQVRLRANRVLDFQFGLAGGAGQYMLIPRVSPPGKPGGETLVRDEADGFDQVDVFGVTIRRVTPNRPKPGDLTFDAPVWDTPLALTDGETVENLLRRISEKTSQTILADRRVGRLSVTVRGRTARVGDLLKALALGVTGAYRKVGDVYLLTGDRTGMGTRKLRIAEWEASLQEETHRLEVQCRRTIGEHSQNGGIRALSYAPDDPLAPIEEIQQEIQWRARRLGAEGDVPLRLLSPALREYARQQIEAYKNPNTPLFRADAVRLEESVGFAFVLPDGGALPLETPLGSLEMFTAEPSPKATTNKAEGLAPARSSLTFPAWAKERMLVVYPDSAAGVARIVTTAKTRGFSRVAIATDDLETVRAGVAAGRECGISMFLIVLPFTGRRTADGGPTIPPDCWDRNLLGETAAEIAAVRAQSPRWQAALTDAHAHFPPLLDPERLTDIPGEVLSPAAPLLRERFQQAATLAAVPELSGVRLRDTQPGGHAGERPDGAVIGYRNDVALAERGNLGYTIALREAFLRQEGVDPVDLIPPGLCCSVDLRLPFFPDDQARAIRSIYTADTEGLAVPPDFAVLNDRWNHFRAERNRTSLTALVSALRAARPELPLLLEIRAVRDNDGSPEGMSVLMLPWKHPDTFPPDVSRPVSLEGLIFPSGTWIPAARP
jgi:hypothetical protein